MRSSSSSMLRDYKALNSCATCRRRHWRAIVVIIDFASLSLSSFADARGLSRNPCCFSPFDFSCHFDFIMQDLCWVHNPLKWEKGPVIQLLKLQRDSLGPERKPAALIPLSQRERFATWLFVAAIWYIRCSKCCCWVSHKEGHKVLNSGFVSGAAVLI